MKELSSRKSIIGGFILGITALGVLYGWFAYADEISTDVNAVAGQVASSTNNLLPLDADSITLLTQIQETVQQVQNQGIVAGLYSQGPQADDPTATRAANVMVNHFQSFCATNPIGPETGGNCPSDPLLTFGDTKAPFSSTMLDAAQMAAVNQYLYNLIPIPATNFAPLLSNGTISVTNLPTSLPSSNPNAQNYQNPQQMFASALSDQAMLSIARQPYAEMIAKRTPPTGGGNQTMMQILEKVGVQRFFSSAWASSLPNLQTNQLLSELALMQAYMVMMEYERYKQGERQEAMLSALILQNYNASQVAQAAFANQPTGQLPASVTGGSTSSSTSTTTTPAIPSIPTISGTSSGSSS